MNHEDWGVRVPGASRSSALSARCWVRRTGRAAATAGLALLAVALGPGAPPAQDLPSTCDSRYTSLRDPFLHFTAYEDKDGAIRGRLKNVHEDETARQVAIRFTFSLNPQGGGYQGSYCLVLGDLPPGGERDFTFVRPEPVRTVLHVKSDPHGLW